MIRASDRHGIDADTSVISAASFLRAGKIRFSIGGFEQVDDHQIDVLIAVNWIHELDEQELTTALAPLLARTRYLIVDRILPGSPASYRYRHGFAFLAERASVVPISCPSEPHREFLIWDLSATHNASV